MLGSYYDIHAEKFIKSALEADMSALHARFLKHLKPNSRILDAGCGPGRDALAFKKMGHQVTAFDASPAMVDIASRILSQPVFHCTFQEISFREEFDAVWACASLLHVAKEELSVTLDTLSLALVPEGILYLSFKYGTGERVADDSRLFTDLDEIELKNIVAQCDQLEFFEIWKTYDCRPERSHELWLNAILCKRL